MEARKPWKRSAGGASTTEYGRGGPSLDDVHLLTV